MPFPLGDALVLSRTICEGLSAAAGPGAAGTINWCSVPAPCVHATQKRFEAAAFNCFAVKLSFGRFLPQRQQAGIAPLPSSCPPSSSSAARMGFDWTFQKGGGVGRHSLPDRFLYHFTGSIFDPSGLMARARNPGRIARALTPGIKTSNSQAVAPFIIRTTSLSVK